MQTQVLEKSGPVVKSAGPSAIDPGAAERWLVGPAFDLLFIANATGYYDNAPFRWKMLLMLLAGVNMLYFQLVTFRGVATWDSGNPPLPARTAGISSILLWSGVIGLGRWIGFTT